MTRLKTISILGCRYLPPPFSCTDFLLFDVVRFTGPLTNPPCLSLPFFTAQIFLFCVQEPADGCGGETPLVKNSELLSTLDPDIVRRFEEKQVRYVRYFPDKSNGEYLSWQHVYETNNREVGLEALSFK